MSKKTPLACVILAAGKGARMKSKKSKVMHELAGRPLINWLIETAETMEPEKIIIVTSQGADDIAAAVAPHSIAIQENQRGTADAVKAAMPALSEFKGNVIVLYGDGPLYTEATLRHLHHALKGSENTGMAFLSMQPKDPTGYGRMITDEHGYLTSIVEEKDADAAQRSIDLCFTGIMCADKAGLENWLSQVNSDNAAGEFYLTDLPAIAAKSGKKTIIALGPTEESLGANTRAELAILEHKVQEKIRARVMENGATLMDPQSTYFSWDTKIGQDVVIEPNVFFAPGVTIEDSVQIRAFSHLEAAHIKSGAIVGPFARLRPGAEIGEDCKIGNFVEIKNATLGKGAKANHHGYIGDADIGAGVNFSCGAITVNYDGQNKHRTIIGDNAMIGSNVSLVAPVEIGAGAYVAAGSTITKPVPADALAVAREKPTIIDGWAAKRRGKKAG